MRKRKWQDAPDVVARLKSLWLAGWSGKEIAAQLGVSPGSVFNEVRRLGLPNRVSRHVPTLQELQQRGSFQ